MKFRKHERKVSCVSCADRIGVSFPRLLYGAYYDTERCGGGGGGGGGAIVTLPASNTMLAI
jgi:hypothetical protein